MKYVIIVGTGGFARELLWLIQDINQAQSHGGRTDPSYRVLGFIAEDNKEQWASDLGGLPIMGDDDWAFEHLERNVCFVPGVGSPGLRRKIAEKYLEAGFRSLTLVHPSVHMADDVVLGQGAVLCAGSILTTNIQVGAYVIVNLNATVGHDCTIGDYTTIHPGVNVSGQVFLGEEVELGTGAALIQGVSVGDQAVIGAGAVVTKDLEGEKTYVGVPAREI